VHHAISTCNALTVIARDRSDVRTESPGQADTQLPLPFQPYLSSHAPLYNDIRRLVMCEASALLQAQ
jgi:hypothetical protein